MSSQLVTEAVNTLVPLLASVLVAFISYALNALAKKFKSDTVQNVAQRVSDLAHTVVLEIQQVVVDDLRDAAKDGVITIGEATQAKERALSTLKQHLGEKGKADALSAFGFKDEAQLDAYLETQLEAAVATAKRTFGTKLSASTDELGKAEAKVEVQP